MTTDERIHPMRYIAALRAALHAKADTIRQDWTDYVARWEADTEPGYPLTGMDRDRRNLALAWANLLDALAGRR